MHFFNIKPTVAILLTLTTANIVTANMQHRSAHIHRRAEIEKRAGAAYNETDTRSVELGHQASLSSEAAAAAAASTSSVVAAVTATSASEVVDDVTTSALGAGQASSSTAAVGQTAQTSSVVAETDDIVTSTATATPLAAETSISSSSVLSTSSIVPTTSSTSDPAVLATTSTSTSTVMPTTSIIRSTVTPTQDAISSVASLVRTTARTASASASVSAASGSSEQGSSKLSVGKTAMIAIIVVASVIVGALAIWTIIRKWKLGPSKKFDERMQPLDFSPNAGMPDPFLEKTRNRFSNSSVSSADRQRRQFVSELDAAEQEKYAYETQPNYLHGVPSHDFTAPATGGGVASSHYGPAGGAGDYDPYGYPPHGGAQHDYAAHADETVGGNGYADLRRGPSTVGTNFAGMGAGPGGLASASAAAPPVPPIPQHAADMGYDHQETLYSDNPSSLGRPTQGEGPYFAASQARY